MGRYGEAATNAVNFLHDNIASTPLKAWEMATIKIFGEGTWGQVKGCPRSSFLGLSEEGLIKGVPKGHYTKSQKIKKCVIKAVELIKNNSELADNQSNLWKQVVEGRNISHNFQMDKVISLLKSKFIDL
ncbi:hypothetical protein AN963_20775 [Brevibacillus choshinensis]|uniref:Uncharacterized protein n=1 Tax=Brevibacillus choshinensis TaxID=54911 RepID=A0ABR5N0D0_BRECH|nr:hypothetical protein [Brevibacillus choshinensis]KQL43898.1 hypothetical protein AN963_20775 [Brevibacillus choshinensis]